MYMTSPDLLVVLGKNIGVGSSPAVIRMTPDYLSEESRMNANAAGMLYAASPDVNLLFSSGHTSGPDVPSEAAAMRDYLLRGIYIPEEVAEARIALEEKSIDTATNAKEVARMLEETGPNYGRIDLVTVGFHTRNAKILFKRYGVPVEEAIASEDIIRERSKADEAFIQEWLGTTKVRKEIQRERVRSVLLATIDRRGKLPHVVASLSRG
jgi:uncharacterized SAM-binding protein YcdF (DUF218 family)